MSTSPLQVPDHIDALDGIRGMASLWVLIGHTLLLTGWRVPLVSEPGLAVDLFMMLSGLLMTWHYECRRAREPWERPSTWRAFWLRRFFRIAPLYYAILVPALAFGPWFGAERAAIAGHLPAVALPADHYSDQGWRNVIAHLSFVFGALPAYSFRTVLPDWSIGLEMQFYLVFPGLMLLVGRWGYLAMCALALGAALVPRLVAGNYLADFAMPSLLAIKLNMFLAGMLIAAAKAAPGRLRAVYLGVAAGLVLVPLRQIEPPSHLVFYMATVLTLATLIIRPGRVARVLGQGVFHLTGELSYGVYLMHLLVLIPMAAFVWRHFAVGAPMRFLACLCVVLPVAYLVAWLFHHGVEKPGILWGKRLIRTVTPQPAGPESRVMPAPNLEAGEIERSAILRRTYPL